MSSEPRAGEVRLVLPALPEYLRLARLTAGGLASRLGFSYEDVEDLRIGIDELCFYLVGNEGREGTITLQYAITPDGLEIEGRAGREGGSGPPVPLRSAVSELSVRILDSVVDEYSVSSDPPGPAFRLLKRHRAAAPGRPGERGGPGEPGEPGGLGGSGKSGGPGKPVAGGTPSSPAGPRAPRRRA
ncbi:MAG: ATP-binding protein [Acidimicrobiales bacterium]